MARGETRAEAEAAARRELGSELLVREATRRQWGWSWVERVAQDFALSVRAVRRSPRYFVAAVLCIAAGTGATVTIYSALQAVLFRPLPYPAAERLVAVEVNRPRREARFAEMTQLELNAWRSARSLDGVATWRTAEGTVSGREDLPERVITAEATPALFEVLGRAPAYGAIPAAHDEGAVILSDALWRGRYGGDRSIIGRTIQFNGRPLVVAAVMPPEFSFPDRTQLWQTLPEDVDIPPDILFYGGAVARLAAGHTYAQARAEIGALSQRLMAEGGVPPGTKYDLVTLRDHLLGALRRPVLIFQGAALLVLLVACANVAALQLARSATRRREFALRAAIGAGRGALAGHVIVESLTLAIAGGVAGTALGFAGTRLLASAFPDGVPPYIDLSVDAPVLAGALAATLLSALLFGIAPSLRASRTRAPLALDGSAHGSGGVGRRAFRNALVTVEVAVSVVLLIGAALLVRSDVEMRRTLGFEPARLLSTRIPLSYTAYPEPGQRLEFYRRLEQRLRELPGVEVVSSSFRAVPLDAAVAGFSSFRMLDEDDPASPDRRASVQHVGPQYAGALGMRLQRGRDISTADGTGAELAALVNRTFVAQHSAGSNPIGRLLVLGAGNDTSRPIRIVGVVDDVLHERPPADVPPTLYLRDASMAASHTFLLRTSLEDPGLLVPAIRELVHEMDPMMVASRIQTQEHVVRRAFWRERLQRNVVAIFASLALLLAVFGMYGVISYAVAQRTAEFGVRVAVGASTSQLLLLVLREAATVAAAGVALGAAAALALTRLLGNALYGVSATDPLTFAAVAGVLLIVAVVSALGPALRAARLHPMTALSGA